MANTVKTLNGEERLRRAADHLFGSFRAYRGDPGWGDPLSMPDEARDAAIATTPVRNLDAEYFYYYGWKALAQADAGTPALKYFLPRVAYEAAFSELREAMRYRNGPLDLDFYISYMNEHDWQSWPSEERLAIEDFFTAWFDAALETTPVWQNGCFTAPEKRCMEPVLRSMAFLGLDIHAALAAWAGNESSWLTLQIADMVNYRFKAIRRSASLKGWGELWGKTGVATDKVHEVVRFLTSARTCSRLERAFFDTPDPLEQKPYAEAADNLRRIYQAWASFDARDNHIPQWAREVAAVMSREK
jgi:hypothetical protein